MKKGEMELRDSCQLFNSSLDEVVEYLREKGEKKTVFTEKFPYHIYILQNEVDGKEEFSRGCF